MVVKVRVIVSPAGTVIVHTHSLSCVYGDGNPGDVTTPSDDVYCAPHWGPAIMYIVKFHQIVQKIKTFETYMSMTG